MNQGLGGWPAINVRPASGLIRSQELQIPTSPVRIAVPNGYRNIRLIIVSAVDAAVSSATVDLQINDDTGSNYDFQAVNHNNTTTTAGGSAGTTGLRLGYSPGTTAPAGSSSQIHVDMANVSSTRFFKTMMARSATKFGSTTSSFYHDMQAGFWRSTAAVILLSITCSSGSFVAGSLFQLWGDTDG